jgi:hypothetical protein
METPSSRATSNLISKSLETVQETPGQVSSKEMQDLSAMILKAMDDPAFVETVCPSGGCPELRGLLLEVVERAKEEDDSPEVKACVSKKIPILIEEGYPRAQSVAIAFSVCRKDPSVADKAVKVEGTPRYMTEAELRAMKPKKPETDTDTEIESAIGCDLDALNRTTSVLISKAGTSDGAKLGWETRRGGAPTDEPKAGMPSRQEWDGFQSNADAVFDVSRGAVKEVERIEERAIEAEEEGRSRLHPFGVKEPTTPKGVEQALNKLADVAPKAADLAARLKGVPGVDEGKRKAAEDKMRGWKGGVPREEMQDFNDIVSDIYTMVDSARADHDPKYMEGSEPVTRPSVGKELVLNLGVQKRFLSLQDLEGFKPTKPEDVRPPRESTRHEGEPEDSGLRRLIMPGWARKGGQVAPPGDVPKDRIRGDGLTEMLMPSRKEDEPKE